MYRFKEVFWELPLPLKIKKNVFVLEAVRNAWEKVVGKKLSRVSRPLFFEEGFLIVGVPDYYYLQMFNLNSYLILKKLKNVLPEEIKNQLSGIKFKIERNYFKKNSKFTEKDECKELNPGALVQEIEDPELKKTFEELFKTYNLAIKKSKYRV